MLAAVLRLSCAKVATSRPCDGDFAAAPWCDTSRSIDARVEILVANLTIEEKAGLFVMEPTWEVPRLQIPSYGWWSEGLHGLARDGIATSFPQIIGVASSFNNPLFRALGRLTAIEARGKNNAKVRQGSGRFEGLTLWAPNVNIFRGKRRGSSSTLS